MASASVVLQIARFGDLVQTRRLILSLEGRGDVHLVVENSLIPLARLLHPGVHVHGALLHTGKPEDVWTSCERLLADLRDADVGAVYNANFSPLTAALCRRFPQEIVHGYRPRPGGIAKSWWVRLAFALGARRRLATLNLVDFWGHFLPNPIDPALVNPPAKPGGKGVGIVLAGQVVRRSLPETALADIVATAFRCMDGPRLFLLGTRGQAHLARGLLRRLPGSLTGKVENCCGKTDWPGLLDALGGLDAVVCPDTGVMHLAAHLGVPALAFFLSSAWCHETGPYGLGHHVWQSAPPCAPCLETGQCAHELCCAAPLSSRKLQRSLAMVLAGETPADPGEGLSLWRSGIDALGGTMDLLAGTDDEATRRGIVRGMLGSFVGLGDACVPHDVSGEDAAFRESLYATAYRDADMALPRCRYV